MSSDGTMVPKWASAWDREKERTRAASSNLKAIPFISSSINIVLFFKE
jgi:hypothetical protein